MKIKVLKAFIIIVLGVVINFIPTEAFCTPDTATAAVTSQQQQTSPHYYKRLLKKFLAAMFGVGCAGCAVYIIFAMLKGIRKDKDFDIKLDSEDADSFVTPDNINSAIVAFLKKLK